MSTPYDDTRADEYNGRHDSNLPVPDPTRLTTQLVDRALSAFREVVFMRLAGMDKATELLAAELAKMQTQTRDEHVHLKEDRHREADAQREFIISRIDVVDRVSLEKFSAIDTQFRERDTRTEQAAQESRISLDAALAAAKEAVSEQNKANALAIGKSEDATKERLDALAVLFSTSNKSLEDKITALTSRLDRGEGAGAGAREQKTDSRTLIFGAIAVATGIGGLAIGAFLR